MVTLKQKELFKDIFKPSNLSFQWLKIYSSYLIGLSTIAIILLPWQGYKVLRLLTPLTGLISISYGLIKTNEIKEYELDYQIRKDARLNCLKKELTIIKDENSLPVKDREDLIKSFDCQSFLNEVTGIAILGNSGSAKTCLVNYLAGELSPASFLILDPHADPENDQYPWGGFNCVISDKAKILEILGYLLDLLDRKDKQRLIIICDEYPAIRAYAKSQKSAIADDFILRYGSEARKFNKLPIFISQSGNTKALGLEGMGDFLENFGLIRLGKIAKKYLKYSSNIAIREACNTLAYPMLINDDELFLHPTHGHYSNVRKNQKPINIKPVKCEPLPFNFGGIFPTSHNFPQLPPEVPQPLYSHNFPTSTSLNDTLSLPIKAMVVNAIKEGKKDTFIIENILNLKGRKFSQGKEILEKIRQEME